MHTKNGAHAPMGSACLEKAATLYFVTHPKAPRPLFGPFLSQADAELGLIAIRSAGAVVEARPHYCMDDLTRIRAEAHGRTVRAFMDRQGVRHD